MTDAILPEPEFSRPVLLAKLGSHAATYQIEAGPAERERLAKRFDLLALDRLTATVTLSRAGEGAVRLEATMSAAVTQSCVVTLDPVPAEVEERFSLLFRPDIDEDEADRLALEDPDEETIEPLIGDAIDIGEAIAQELSVALDPFPRTPAAIAADIAEFGSDAPPHPFAALARLKKPV